MDWTIDIRGPDGVKHVTVPANRVTNHVKSWPKADPYRVATFMAYQTLIREEDAK